MDSRYKKVSVDDDAQSSAVPDGGDIETQQDYVPVNSSIVQIAQPSRDAGSTLESNELKSPDSITIKVQSTDDKKHIVRISKNSQVLELKEQLNSVMNLPPERQRLIFAGKILRDEDSLISCKIVDGNVVHLVPKLFPVVKPEISSATPGETEYESSGTGNLAFGNRAGNVILEPRTQVAVNVQSLDSQIGVNEENYGVGLWKSRVRVICVVMFLYYSLSLWADILALCLPPAQNSISSARPGEFYFVHHRMALSLADLLESLLGVVVASGGIRAANSGSLSESKMLVRRVLALCSIHFTSLALWILALMNGEIILVPPKITHHLRPDTHYQRTSDLVGHMIVLHLIIWMTILYVVAKMHTTLIEIARVHSPYTV